MVPAVLENLNCGMSFVFQFKKQENVQAFKALQAGFMIYIVTQESSLIALKSLSNFDSWRKYQWRVTITEL